MQNIIIKKEVITKFIDAARYAAWRLREYDEPEVHDQAVQDGFTVVNGHCNQPECVLCELERRLARIDDELDPQWGIQVDTRVAQTSLI